MTAEILIAITLWCGAHGVGNGAGWILQRQVQLCRDRVIACFEAAQVQKKDPNDNLIKCAKAEKLPTAQF